VKQEVDVDEPQTLGDFDDGAPPLRVWTNREDFVVARSASDAVGAYYEAVGDVPRVGDASADVTRWRALPDAEVLPVRGDAGTEYRTCAEWCVLRGRSHLASVNT
jgi:hypothetical protein